MTNWEVIREMSGGEIYTEITLTHKDTGEVVTVVSDTKRTSPQPNTTSQPYAVVKGSNGITLSLGYQSVRLEVGGELPWPVEAGKTEGLRDGYNELFDLIDDELVKRSEGIKALLEQLVREHTRR